MQRRLAARRVIVAAALTVGGGLFLGGCRSDPTIAAYVGPETITEAQVTQIFEELHAVAEKRDAESVAAGKPAPTAQQRIQQNQLTQQQALTTLLLEKVCGQAQAKQGFTTTPVAVEDIAKNEGVSATGEYAKARAKMSSCLSGIKIDSATGPSDADLQDIYDRAKANGLVEAPLSEIKDQLAQSDDVRQAVATKRLLANLIAEGDVTVNPRYRPIELPISQLGTEFNLVVVSLGDPGSDAVRNLS